MDDPETTRKIQQTVTDILNSSNLDTVTEKHVRQLSADKLGLDLSDLPHKILVRQVIESYLLSHDDTLSPHSFRVVCKLSQKKDVAVRSSGGKTFVSIREFVWRDGKQVLTPKWISLSTDQWSTFRKNIPEIEEAIKKAESSLRLQDEKRPANADNSENMSHQNGIRQVAAEPMQKIGTHQKPGFMDFGKRVGNESSVSSTPHRLVPTDVIRFNGKNYQEWADHMESYLNHLKVGYVLSVPCPTVAGVADRELTKTLSAIEKWIDDDHICRQNIINTLCDNMFGHYSKKRGPARDLWEELKNIYLYEEHGAKVSLVKKYTEFQIVEDKSIIEQVEELHHIADSLIACGLYVEEKFHVNVIISKLPPSWKPCSIDLMKEDYLPVWMLMNELKAEVESRQKGSKNEGFLPRHVLPIFQPCKKLGPHRMPMKRPGTPMAHNEVDRDRKLKFCDICKRKGHLPDQCWFRNSSCKDTTVENENGTSANVVAEGAEDEAARKSSS